MVALACPERFVVGLDVSEIAIKQATKVRANTFGYFDLVCQDLLTETVSKIYVTSLQYLCSLSTYSSLLTLLLRYSLLFNAICSGN